MDSPQSVNKLLRDGGGRLAQLAAQADSVGKLAWLVDSRLRNVFRGEVTFGRYEGGVMVLIAASSAWASRARFAVAEIQALLSNTPECADVREIQIRVGMLPHDPPSTERHVPSPLANTTRAHLAQCAADLPPGPVRDALTRLGKE